MIYCLVTAELYVQFSTTLTGESPIYILEGDIDNVANILPTFISCNFEFTQAVVAICEELHASEYINSVGGKSLYERTAFGIRGIQLSFLQTRSVVYTQFGKQFSPNLSIIDVLMFNTPEQRRNLLAAYDLQ